MKCRFIRSRNSYRNQFGMLLPCIAVLTPCQTTNASLVDFTVSGHLTANSSLPFQVRYRVDTQTIPTSTDTNTSLWLYNFAFNNSFVVEVEGYINDIEFNLTSNQLNSPSALQLMSITDHQPGDGHDSFWLGASADSPGSIVGADFRLTQPNGNSSLIGTTVPIDQAHLDLNSFEVLEFSYTNISGNTGTGVIQNLSVSVVPAPTTIVPMGLTLAWSRRRKR